jgi:tetratricopeptide (TPR) repeat protein
VNKRNGMPADARRDRRSAVEPAEASDRERALGEAAADRRDVPTAMKHLRRAARIADDAGLEVQAGRARVLLAGLLALRGDFAGADREASRAAEVLGGTDLACLEAQRGYIAYSRGRLNEALERFRRALPGLQRGGETWVEGSVLANRALVHAHQGAFAPAEVDLRRAKALFDSLGDDRTSADVELNLGWLAARRGDVPSALVWFDRADEYFRQEGLTEPAALFDRCEALLVARLAGEARHAAAEAVERLGEQGPAALMAQAQLRLAEAALLQGDAASASKAAATALAAFTRQRRPSFAALARYASLRAAWMSGERAPGLVRTARRAADDLAATGWTVAALDARLVAAQLALDSGQIAAARRELEHARAARRRGPAHVRSRLWHVEALLRLAHGDRPGADSALRAGIRVLDSYRAVLGATELRAHFSAHATDLAALGLRLALDDGKATRVLAWAERWRAGSLHPRPVRPPPDPDLAKDLAALRRVSSELAERAASGRSSARLLARQAALENAVRDRARHAPGQGLYRALPAPTVQACRAALGPRALVEMVESGGALHAVVIAASRPKLRTLGPAGEVEAELHGLRFALRRLAMGYGSAASRQAARAGLATAARNLDRMLLGPVEADIGDRELVLVPTGALHAVPWSLLPSLTARPLSVAPSLALWHRAHSTEAHLGTTAKVVLVVGPGLPGAETEVSHLGESYPGACWLADSAATALRVTAALDGADLAHIAAHGRFRSDNALFSCLDLADGPLTVYDLEALERAPTTIVLSACDSGLSEVCAGDELMGLAAALFTLGSRCLIAAVVPVDDRSTLPLMVALHDALRAGMAPAAALAAAQVRATAKGGSPESSGSFVCFGAG